LKILIAEDDLTSRLILAAVTKKWGYTPITVEDGEAAWEVMQDADPPLLLLIDWGMPKLDGITLCKKIRKQESENPPYIVLLTARNETDDVVKGLEAGANDYISKPYNNAELQARLCVGQRMLNLQTELFETKNALQIQATHDALTGLLNRGAIMAALEKEMDRAIRQSKTLTIGMCDIDHFKQVNDNHGHLAGDEVLREVAKRFRSSLRPYDEIGRYGGEEFLFLLHSSIEQAPKLFERIRRDIADTPISANATELTITISCGVTFFIPPKDKRDATSLLAAADKALYQAKDGGRNLTIFGPVEKT
jgi:two-component system cell cycle response regulator